MHISQEPQYNLFTIIGIKNGLLNHILGRPDKVLCQVHTATAGQIPVWLKSTIESQYSSYNSIWPSPAFYVMCELLFPYSVSYSHYNSCFPQLRSVFLKAFIDLWYIKKKKKTNINNKKAIYF